MCETSQTILIMKTTALRHSNYGYHIHCKCKWKWGKKRWWCSVESVQRTDQELADDATFLPLPCLVHILHIFILINFFYPSHAVPTGIALYMFEKALCLLNFPNFKLFHPNACFELSTLMQSKLWKLHILLFSNISGLELKLAYYK